MLWYTYTHIPTIIEILIQFQRMLISTALHLGINLYLPDLASIQQTSAIPQLSLYLVNSALIQIEVTGVNCSPQQHQVQ